MLAAGELQSTQEALLPTQHQQEALTPDQRRQMKGWMDSVKSYVDDQKSSPPCLLPSPAVSVDHRSSSPS